MRKKKEIKDIKDKKIGKLTAISFIKRENKYTYWLYKCDCGKEVIKKAAYVQNGKTQSCGCLQKKHCRKITSNKLLSTFEMCTNRLYRNYERAAKDRNLEFNLTKEEFLSYLDKDCYYCGCKPRNLLKESNNRELLYTGIDRKINSLGYSISNCVSSCYMCNKMKLNLDEDVFLKQVNKINNYKNE